MDKEFFARIAEYFDKQGWEKPGTMEQFKEAVFECWGATEVTGPSGKPFAALPEEAVKALGLLPWSAN